MTDTDSDEPTGQESKFAFRFDRDVDENTGETVEISDPAEAGTTDIEKKEDIPESSASEEREEPVQRSVAPEPLSTESPQTDKPETDRPETPKREWTPISAVGPARDNADTDSEEEDQEDEKDTLAGLIAGRKLETPEAERTFLLTLSRDQRLRYADLIQANERLDFDRERLAVDEEQMAVERERIGATDRARRETQAAAFATSVLRTVVGLNGAACLVLVILRAVLQALGTSFSGPDFRFALYGFALGTAAGVVASACAYARHWALGTVTRKGTPSPLALVFRILAGLLAAIGMVLFVAGVIYVGKGLDAS